MQFVLPVKFNFIWSTYIWDFIKKSIFVLDPTMNNGDESDKVLQANHRRVAQKLHHEIAKCIKAFFIGWSPEMDKWKTYFPRWTCPAISKRFDRQPGCPGDPKKKNYYLISLILPVSFCKFQPPQRGICCSFRKVLDGEKAEKAS
jgi:hypothetical protein